MARHGQDREDLLREAIALAPRGEFAVPGIEESVVVGFRGRAASVYVGADPAWHFNTLGEVRRGFVDGRLLKAQAGRLIQMQRVRVPGEVQLRSRPLSDEEQQGLIDRLQRLLDLLDQRLSSGDFRLVGEAPGVGQVIDRAVEFLQTANQDPIGIAAAPNVDPGKMQPRRD